MFLEARFLSDCDEPTDLAISFLLLSNCHVRVCRIISLNFSYYSCYSSLVCLIGTFELFFALLNCVTKIYSLSYVYICMCVQKLFLINKSFGLSCRKMWINCGRFFSLCLKRKGKRWKSREDRYCISFRKIYNLLANNNFPINSTKLNAFHQTFNTIVILLFRPSNLQSTVLPLEFINSKAAMRVN